MNGNIELLNFIYQNAEMGKDTIKHLMDISDDEEFKVLLKAQYDQYKQFFDSAERIINEQHKDAKSIDPLSRTSAYMMINFKTLRDKSSSHIAEMLIQGSTMGIVDLTKKIDEYSEANDNVLELATNLLKFEENGVEELKKFLKG